MLKKSNVSLISWHMKLITISVTCSWWWLCNFMCLKTNGNIYMYYKLDIHKTHHVFQVRYYFFGYQIWCSLDTRSVSLLLGRKMMVITWAKTGRESHNFGTNSFCNWFGRKMKMSVFAARYFVFFGCFSFCFRFVFDVSPPTLPFPKCLAWARDVWLFSPCHR